jgi:hypothetical protein
MPSIFIWKSSTSNTSKKHIQYYSGSNWVLEDNNISSKSYMFMDQIVIPGFNDSVITFNIKYMPQDWVGSELLEVISVPYELIKSDNYGSLEKIGDWMRFTSKTEITFDTESLQSTLADIEKWMKVTTSSNYIPKSEVLENNASTAFNIDINNVQHSFQEFLNKYGDISIIAPVNINNFKSNTNKQNNYNKQNGNTNNIKDRGTYNNYKTNKA